MLIACANLSTSSVDWDISIPKPKIVWVVSLEIVLWSAFTAIDNVKVSLNTDKESSGCQLNVLEKYPDLLEQGSFKIVTFDRNDLRESLEDTLSMDSYFAHPNGIHNFKVTLKRKGTKTDTSYTLTPELLTKTPAAVSKAWEEAKDTIWLPALYEQGDPFKGKPAEPKEPVCGLPPTKRDDYGADTDIASATTDKDNIGDDWS